MDGTEKPRIIQKSRELIFKIMKTSCLEKLEKNATDISKIYGGNYSATTGTASVVIEDGSTHVGQEGATIDQWGCAVLWVSYGGKFYYGTAVC